MRLGPSKISADLGTITLLDLHELTLLDYLYIVHSMHFAIYCKHEYFLLFRVYVSGGAPSFLKQEQNLIMSPVHLAARRLLTSPSMLYQRNC